MSVMCDDIALYTRRSKLLRASASPFKEEAPSLSIVLSIPLHRQTSLACLMDTDRQETFPNALHSMISSNAIRLDSLVW